MKCYYHPEEDAVGMCTRCGKAVCSECARGGGGALICIGCEVAMRQEEAARAGLSEALAARTARRTVILSWVVTGVVPLVYIIAAWSDGSAPLWAKIFVPIIGTYAGWSWFWGCVLIRDRWAPSPAAGKRPWGCGMIIFMYLVVAPFLGPYGGGIYQFLRYRAMLRQLQGARAASSGFTSTPERNASTRLKELAKNEDLDFREIRSLKVDDPQGLDRILGLFSDADPDVRAGAAAAFVDAPTVDADFYAQHLDSVVTPVLLRLLKDPSPKVRAQAAIPLAGVDLSRWSHDVVGGLMELLKQQEIMVHHQAAQALFLVACHLATENNDAETVTEILTLLARHEDPKNREWFPEFFRRHSRECPDLAAAMKPLLKELAEDSSPGVREYATEALRAVDEPS